MARHDAKRTGLAPGSSDAANPVPYWRAYLGGVLGPGQVLMADVNGDGRDDFLVAAGGGVLARMQDDQTLWQSSPRSIVAIADVADVNGDSISDVIAYSGDHVYVLSSATGAIEWAEPDGEMGTIGAVRVGDLDGDGKPDVLIQECGCCGVNSGRTGYAYSFGQGFSAPKVLLTMPFVYCGGNRALSLFDADGKPPLEILAADYSHFAVIRGSDGATLAATGTVGTWTSVHECYPANIDGVPGDEVVCIENSSEPPATNQRRATVLHYDYTTQPPALNVLWSKTIAPDTGGDARWLDPVADLDGDGTYEVVVSVKDPTNGWQTQILDAGTGALLAAIPNQTIDGIAPMEDPAKRVILTDSAGTVTGWTFSRAASPPVAQQWALVGVTLLDYAAFAQIPLRFDATTLVSTDLNGDGLADVLASTSTSNVTGYSAAGGKAKAIAALALPTDVDEQYTFVTPTPNSPIALARSDGVLNLLAPNLQPASGSSGQISVHFGGYYASGGWRELAHAPRLAPFPHGAGDAVIVDDSRSALLRLNASVASWASPPARVWEVPHTFGPEILANLDGNDPAIACLSTAVPATVPPTYRVRVVRSDGSVKWDVPLPGTPLADLAPGTFNSDGVPDVSVQLGDSVDTNLVTVALSGATGGPLWTTAPFFPGAGGLQSVGMSVSDWNGDGTDDIFFQGTGTRVLSGATGSQLAQGGPNDAYRLPLLFDTNGDGTDEAVLHAGFSPVQLYSHDLQTALWLSTDDDRPYPYGSIAQCPGTTTSTLLVEGSWKNPARLKFTILNGTSLGSFSTVVLAGGKLYSSEQAARTAGAFLGQLTAANVDSNLTGQGRPTAVVGSSDGWLYGVNPCTGTLDFSVPFGVEVGEAVFGDTDGDGRDEILVTAADGYLYDLKNNAINKPAYVWDTDPDHGITNHDVDDIETTDKLSATWAPVAGATGYAVEVVTADGTLISTPAWQNVGSATSTSVMGLPLANDMKYFFAVRALSTSGPSVDAMSNGVTVHFPADAGTPPGVDASTGDAGINEDAGTENGDLPSGGGCACETSADPAGSPWIAIFLVPLTIFARRSHRPGRA